METIAKYTIVIVGVGYFVTTALIFPAIEGLTEMTSALAPVAG